MPESVLTILLLIELGLWVLCWFRLQDTALPFAEALARAVALTLAGLGLGIMLFFLLHLAHAPWLPDAALLPLAAYARRAGRRRFWPECLAAARDCRREPWAWFLAASLLVLAFLVLAVPPSNWDSMTYNLARVLLMMQDNSLAPTHYNTIRQVAFSPGFDVLHYFFLRYGADRGVAAFSWLSYLLIVLGSHAVARRWGDRAFALRVAVLVGSLKLLVLQASSTKNDIGAAAMAVACVLGAARVLGPRPRLGDVTFLLAAACYGLSTKSYFLFFAGPFTGLVLLARGRPLLDLARRAARDSGRRLAATAAVLLAALALGLASQWINLARFDNPFGPPAAVAIHRNADGLAGFGANLARYAMDFLDAPGKWWFEARRDLHVRLFGPGKGPGAFMPFHERYFASSELHEDASWFGLLGGLLVAPCILAGLFRRDALARLAAIGLCAFLLAVSATIIWFSFNNRFLSLFFAASAPCLAAARDVWHDRAWVRRPVLAVAALTMAAALAGNQAKPLVDGTLFSRTSSLSLTPSVFRQTGGRRADYDTYFGGPLLLDYLSRGLPPGRRALLVAGADSWVYPILFYTRHDWLVLGDDNPLVELDGQTFDIRDCQALRRLAGRFDVVVSLAYAPGQACLASGRPVLETRTVQGEPVLVFSPGTDAAGNACR